MSDATDTLAWVPRAEEDYALARSSLRRRRPLVYGACFHAQQCVEKYLKAALVARGQAFPWTHDLVALADLCTKAGLPLAVHSDQLDILSAYAVRVRYPGEELSLADAKSAFEIVKDLRRSLRKALGL